MVPIHTHFFYQIVPTHIFFERKQEKSSDIEQQPPFGDRTYDKTLLKRGVEPTEYHII